MRYLALSPSILLRSAALLYIALVMSAVYTVNATYLNSLLAAGGALFLGAGLTYYLWRMMRRMPTAIELNKNGHVVLFFLNKTTQYSIIAQLSKVTHWPGLLQDLEFRTADQKRYTVLIMNDALPPELFRTLIVWAKRAQRYRSNILLDRCVDTMSLPVIGQ